MAVQDPIHFISYFMTNMEENQAKEKSKGRRRAYGFILYPDSAPENWRELLDDTHVSMLVSPIHDQDVNPDGTPKKAHYHVLVMYTSPKTEEQFLDLRDIVKGVGNEKVQSTRGYARYLIHKDNPEKAQYKAEDVLALNGADYDAVTHLPTDDVQVLKDMMEYCITNKIYSFADFAVLCSNTKPEWFVSLAHRTTYFMERFIKSLQWSVEHDQMGMTNKEKKLMYLVDPETGEQKEIYM